MSPKAMVMLSHTLATYTCQCIYLRIQSLHTCIALPMFYFLNNFLNKYPSKHKRADACNTHSRCQIKQNSSYITVSRTKAH